MGTRSVIARPDGTGFKGVYHHWDGYPSGVGATLFLARRAFFDGDTEAMLRFLIDEHPAGWSSINGADLRLETGFRESPYLDVPCVALVKGRRCGKEQVTHLCQTYGPDWRRHKVRYPCGDHYGQHIGHDYQPDKAMLAELGRHAQCYCHGSRWESANLLTDKDASGAGCEYAYILDGPRMTIMSSFTDIGSEDGTKSEKMIGFFGMGDENAVWKPVAFVDLDGPEPEWEAINEKAMVSE